MALWHALGMHGLSPSRVPELVATTANVLMHDRKARSWLQRVTEASSAPIYGMEAVPPLGDLAVACARTAELYHIGGAMWQTMQTAAPQLPGFTLHQEDIPCETGMVLFENSVPIMSSVQLHPEAPPEETDLVAGLSWHKSEPDLVDLLIRESTQFKDGLWVTLWVRTDEMGGPPELREIFRREFKAPLIPWSTVYMSMRSNWEPSQSRSAWPAWLLTFFRLLQEAWAKVEITATDRATHRRMLRTGLGDPRTVKVVVLPRRARSEQPNSEEEGEADGTSWSRRWVVEGHWRQQWYPSQQRHAPKWINSYVKGPDDKPLVLKDTVTSIK